eukprot:Gregarina_sp_Poly_1__65@NODE_1012_length_5366_cov_118_438762_g159_i2_p2_GENE_NODE_1012_length_5366_cov_118_438762_g159_i2NODE_1012_length_5366_cov_118_438762_g159_i2_p2_ORF_typecomplete_len378_score75_17RPC_C/PF11800_8/0_45RPC_C/PF11800_8/2_2e03_NODE_1012_length_5366_cov_118_438762_g159_i241415274
MSPASMTEPATASPTLSPSSAVSSGEGKMDSTLGDAMILLDQFFAKIPPSADAPALIEAALAKRKEYPGDGLPATDSKEATPQDSALSTQEPLQAPSAESTELQGVEATDGEDDDGEEEERVKALANAGLLQGIPLRTGNVAGRNELAKINNQNLSPLTTALLRRGYDIRLGEKGRSDLKQEISRKTRETPQLKEACARIARLKQANIHQLIQLAEVCGSLEKALKISQAYWKETCRKNKQNGKPLSKRHSATTPEGEDNEPVDAVGDQVVDGVVAPSGVTIKTSVHCQGELLLDKPSHLVQACVKRDVAAGSEPVHSNDPVSIVVVKADNATLLLDPASPSPRSKRKRANTEAASRSSSTSSDRGSRVHRKQSRRE